MAVLTAPPQIRTSFAPSGLVDLYWAMLTGTHPHGDKEQLQAGPQGHEARCGPERPPVPGVSDDAALTERLSRLWDDGLSDIAELLVVGHHAGLVSGPIDGATLPMALDLACGEIPADLPLASESDANRTIFHRRLRALREDAELRSRYIELVSDVWQAIEENWNKVGLPAATEVARQADERFRNGRAWLPLFADFEDCDDYVATTTERAAETGALLVVVSAFGGTVMLDLPGLQLVGLRMAKLPGDARERATEVARRLRAVADPTRLLLLELLARSPRSVGDLARDLGVSQPTVSNHVKVLREVGVLRTERAGNRLALELDRSSLDAVLSEAGSFVQGAR